MRILNPRMQRRVVAIVRAEQHPTGLIKQLLETAVIWLLEHGVASSQLFLPLHGAHCSRDLIFLAVGSGSCRCRVLNGRIAMQLTTREKQYFTNAQRARWPSTFMDKKEDVAGKFGLYRQEFCHAGQEAGLAGAETPRYTARSERPKAYWTLAFGLSGFDEATSADFIEVDADLRHAGR